MKIILKKDPYKRWIYYKSDDRAANNWQVYQAVYEKIAKNCSSKIPWIIVPSNNKRFRNYLVAETIVTQSQNLIMRFSQK